jgi:hypothetical protein
MPRARLGYGACKRSSMNAIAETLAPSATDLLRRDHTKVLRAFHRYKLTSNPGRKQALVTSVCLALEVHAQVEEEIFYPAMRGADPAVVEKSVPEHDEMRGLIATLRGMEPTLDEYDRVRSQDDRFAVYPGHETAGLEHVVERHETWVLVDKVPAAEPSVEDDPRGAPSR